MWNIVCKISTIFLRPLPTSKSGMYLVIITSRKHKATRLITRLQFSWTPIHFLGSSGNEIEAISQGLGRIALTDPLLSVSGWDAENLALLKTRLQTMSQSNFSWKLPKASRSFIMKVSYEVTFRRSLTSLCFKSVISTVYSIAYYVWVLCNTLWLYQTTTSLETESMYSCIFFE